MRMDFNEGPPPPPELLETLLLDCAAALTQYPEYGNLRRAAAQAFGIAPGAVMPVNGADEGIALWLRGFTGPEAPLVLPVPTFPMYGLYARTCGTPLLSVPLEADYGLDLAGLGEALTQGAALALCSPNNPTGRAVPEGQLRALIEAAAGKPVLMDETYGPTCGQDFSGLLAEFPNLVLLRTLSKAYGLPGLRCGFLLGAPALIQSLDVLRSPFNVNAVAAVLGARLLAEDTTYRERLGQAVGARRTLQYQLEQAGIPTVASDTHFFLAHLGAAAGSATALLRSRNILIKNQDPALPGLVRISVVSAAQAQAFATAFLPWWAQQTLGDPS
jgi:histidinol-phosphate aminotransferase